MTASSRGGVCCGVLLCVAAAASARADVLQSAGPLPPGVSAITVEAGQPLSALRYDRGLFTWLEGGLHLDSALRRFLRPGVAARVKIFRHGCGGFTGRAAAGWVVPRTAAPSWGPRPLSGSANGELALSADLGLGASCSVALFAEVGALVDTRFSGVQSHGFLQSLVGLEWAPWRPLSLLARAGELRGFNGSRSVIAGGAALRF